MYFRYVYLVALLIVVQNLQAQKTDSPAEQPVHSRFIQFNPTSFSNLFTLNIPPVLTIHSGDTVSTETIDAMGFDKKGVKRQRGGNPLTGPFFIADSKAGDVLEIKLNKISLNRAYAFTTAGFVSRSMPDEISKQFKKTHLVRWKIDLENKTGWPDTTYEHLQNFKLPLHPFLGCIGVAPDNRKNEILSFFQGSFGGNMDFSRVRQTATVYLPIFHDGAYFYIGDGHALQGDGEIAGNALETSLDVEFTVRVIRSDSLHLTTPRMEDSLSIISIGSADKLEDALKIASADLLNWLQKDYQLSIEEATQVMSTSIEYRVAEIADPEVVVAAEIKKTILDKIKRSKR